MQPVTSPIPEPADERPEVSPLPWFALSVRPNHEFRTASALEQKGFERFLPVYRQRRQWSDRIKEISAPLFAGYIFCRFDPEARREVLCSPGVICVVGFGNAPAAIDDAEIAALQALAGSGLQAEPHPFLQVGRRVRIASGPLRGLDGVVSDVRGRAKLILSVTILQRSVAVKVDPASLVPA